MMLVRTVLAISLTSITAEASEWRAELVPTPGHTTAVEVESGTASIAIGGKWYRLAPNAAGLVTVEPPDRPALPRDALADGQLTKGTGQVARAWLAEPTDRYDHGILGDAIEAGSLVIERRDGRRGTVALGRDAVFEDLVPRIASIDGHDWIVVVKSYLDRGSALAIIDPDSMTIAAETPPIGHPHAWLNPAGIADFQGDGSIGIAFVRQPHVVGHLELWSWKVGKLTKVAEIANVANHFIGSRALGMSWTADFDGDGHPDLAVPSFDRKSLRIIGFAPHIRDIASVQLPARIATNVGATMLAGRIALIAGLEDGRLVVIRKH